MITVKEINVSRLSNGQGKGRCRATINGRDLTFTWLYNRTPRHTTVLPLHDNITSTELLQLQRDDSWCLLVRRECGEVI